MKWYSERAHTTLTFSLGDTTAVGDSIDIRNYAGAALLLPADFTGTLQLQASHNDTDWAFCNDSSGTPISISASNAGTWVSLSADVFPLPFIRLARTDGAGTLDAGSSSYSLTLALKS